MLVRFLASSPGCVKNSLSHLRSIFHTVSDKNLRHGKDGYEAIPGVQSTSKSLSLSYIVLIITLSHFLIF